MRRMHFTPLALCLMLALAGCTSLPTEKLAVDEDPVVVGSSVRRNFTPLEPAFACLANGLRQKKRPVVSIAVGDVKDYTGKYNQTEGNAITQGGALMVYSALGKLGDVVRVQERFDTRIAELELAYADRRQLGDGRVHSVDAGKQPVPWVPYFGGSILRSDYYIIGGITEVNYNIQSGGFEASVSLVGGKRRTYTMNIGVDLRIIDTQTLVVLKTVSMQKQIKGDEVGVGVYRFFGNDLLDLTVGSKSQEPLQLGVRTTIEQSVLELIGAISGVDADSCVTGVLEHKYSPTATQQPAQPMLPERPTEPIAPPAPKVLAEPALPLQAAEPGAAPVPQVPAAPAEPVAPAALAPVADATPMPVDAMLPQHSGAAVQVAVFELPYESGSAAITPAALAQIETMVALVGTGKGLTFKLLARDTENFPPLQAYELTSQRVRAITDLLGSRGINPARISVVWRPDPSNAGIRHEGAGYQLIASMAIDR